jgi:guanosine-3',5'-bis(diphosphate) 3'-pyrophosphohydrolase
MTGLLGDAFALMSLAHSDSKPWGKLPYTAHPIAVANLVAAEGADPEVIAAALLHDTVEDTWVTLDELHRLHFPARTIRCVDGVSRRPGETYVDFTWRASSEPDSRLVKLADNTHNFGNLPPRDSRTGRYMRARMTLVAANDWYDPWSTLVPDYTPNA